MLSVQPIDFKEACEFVRRLHRHHRPPVGSKLQVAVNDGAKVVAVLIAGRPVSRNLDDGLTLEVTRCCTDGSRNACSLLYAAAWRAAKALGFSRMLTYTLPDEGGASLRAAGAVRVAETTGGGWNRPSTGRDREDDHPLGPKWRWEWRTTSGGERFHVERDEPADDATRRDLFTLLGVAP